MHSTADAVLIRRCGKSNLHTESQLANDLAIFGANCVAKRGRGGGGGEDTSAMPNRRQKAPKSSSATAQLITEANREHLRVVASSTAKPTEGEGERRGRGRSGKREICAMPSATPCSIHSRRKHVAWQSHCTTQSGASLCCASSSRICMQMVG